MIDDAFVAVMVASSLACLVRNNRSRSFMPVHRIQMYARRSCFKELVALLNCIFNPNPLHSRFVILVLV